MGTNAHARDFAARLGETANKDVVKVRRKLSGETPLSLRELAEWSDAFSIDLSTLVGCDASDPEAYPPLYRGLLHRTGERIAFRRPSDLNWGATASTLAAAVTIEDIAIQQLLTIDVARLYLVQALQATGFPIDLVRPEREHLKLLTREAPTVRVIPAITNDPDVWSVVHREIIDPQSSHLVVMVGRSAKARMEEHFAGLLALPAETEYVVPARELEILHELRDVRWRGVAVAGRGEVSVIVIERKRAEPSE